MAKVLLDMAISLDGYVGGPDGADVGLYDWYFSPSEVSRPVITELVEATGAIVGAERLGPGRGWIVLRDPVGMVFCVTGNSPDDP